MNKDVEKRYRGLLERATPEAIGDIFGTDNDDDLNDLTVVATLQVAAAYVAACSADRQEQTLAEQKTLLHAMQEQSKTMRGHSRAMILLTLAIFALTAVQILRWVWG